MTDGQSEACRDFIDTSHILGRRGVPAMPYDGFDCHETQADIEWWNERVVREYLHGGNDGEEQSPQRQDG